MRVLVGCLAATACTGLCVFGFMTAFVGFADQNVADHTYKVGFKHAGDDCGAERLELSVDNGKPLYCGPPGAIPIQPKSVALPGFTEAQNSEVATLALGLGTDGLSAADRSQIQARVDELLAAVPPANLPHHPTYWGARLGWIGIGALVTGLLGMFAMHRSAP
jgi:hypothetical protein